MHKLRDEEQNLKKRKCRDMQYISPSFIDPTLVLTHLGDLGPIHSFTYFPKKKVLCVFFLVALLSVFPRVHLYNYLLSPFQVFWCYLFSAAHLAPGFLSVTAFAGLHQAQGGLCQGRDLPRTSWPAGPSAPFL